MYTCYLYPKKLFQCFLYFRRQCRENIRYRRNIIFLTFGNASQGDIYHCIIDNLLIVLQSLVCTEVCVKSFINHLTRLSVQFLLLLRNHDRYWCVVDVNCNMLFLLYVSFHSILSLRSDCYSNQIKCQPSITVSRSRE